MAGIKEISMYDTQHVDSDFKSVVKILGYTDIALDLSPGIYSQCNSYDTEIYSDVEDYWHQIMVYHGGYYRKLDFIRQFIKYLPNSMFNPVAYRTGKHVDQFLIRLTKIQVDILFSNQLKLLMHDGRYILLKVKINVARFKYTDIEPLSKIKSIIHRQLKRCETIGEFKVLNLNNFYERNTDIYITMSNIPTFEMICQCVVENPEIGKTVRGLKLLNNQIKSLKPLVVLQRINLGYLDLTFNEIDAFEELFYLRPLHLKEFRITNNPLPGIHLALEKIKEILPTVQSIDIRNKVVSKTQVKSSGDYYDTGNFTLSNYTRSNKWHQITVLHNGSCKKTNILEALVELCRESEFFPCYYQEDQHSDSFFVRNCLEAINLIKNANLKLTINDTIIPIRLIMNAKVFDPSEIDPADAIAKELNKCYNLVDRTLNLAAFAVQELTNNLIIDITSNSILTQILNMATRKFGSNIQHINLANNGIASAKGLFPLLNIKSLKSLNLSDNELEEYEDLFTLIAKMKLTDLRLENNPFCNKFSSRMYVKEMKKKLPTLLILDGYIIHEYDFTFNKNYLCHMDYYDFVHKFLKNYFQIFDSQIRYHIVEFYHSEAIYSMSMNCNSKMMTSNISRINKYNQMARNILRCSDFRQYATNLLIGNKIITNYLANLPVTEHDYNSFSIDVTYADENMICIIVNGMVKELGSTLLENDLWFGFTRTFVLTAQNRHAGFLKGGIDYVISNEHMHLFSLNIIQRNNAFKTKQQPSDAPPEITVESALPEIPREIDVKFENECLTEIFMETTKMKLNWSVRCLSLMDRKLLPAIEYFLSLEKRNKIPKIAYNLK